MADTVPSAAPATPAARAVSGGRGWAGGRAGTAEGARRDQSAPGSRPTSRARWRIYSRSADAGRAVNPLEHAGRSAGGPGARRAAVAAAPSSRPGPAPASAAAAAVAGGAAGRRGRTVLQRPMQLEGEVSPAARSSAQFAWTRPSDPLRSRAGRAGEGAAGAGAAGVEAAL